MNGRDFESYEEVLACMAVCQSLPTCLLRWKWELNEGVERKEKDKEKRRDPL
jgi:hypothetical protein